MLSLGFLPDDGTLLECAGVVLLLTLCPVVPLAWLSASAESKSLPLSVLLPLACFFCFCCFFPNMLKDSV